MVDLAISLVTKATDAVAVNAHHRRHQLEAHLGGRVHLSMEEPEALGTAGALGQLRDWIDGRPALVTNADAWLPDSFDAAGFVEGWEGNGVRLLVVPDEGRPDFEDRWRYAGVALMPWSEVAPLAPVPSGLYELSWARAEAEGRLDLTVHDGPFFDCGTPADYLAANLAASDGAAVVAADATVEGEVVRSVVWPGAVVREGEVLVDAIRASERVTVLVR